MSRHHCLRKGGDKDFPRNFGIMLGVRGVFEPQKKNEGNKGLTTRNKKLLETIYTLEFS